MKNFKYKTRFDVPISFANFKKSSENKLISAANISNLAPLMPNQEIIKDNPDLLYTVFNVAVANLINANDDGIRTEEALKINESYKLRYGNIEHNRYACVGVVINSGFSKFSTNELVSAEELKGTSDPFNLSLAAVVWKNVDPYFCDFLENCSEDISASWELLFDEYYIVRGSKRIKDAEIITDDKEIAKYLPYLRANGGSGFDPTGKEIYRLIVGNVQPLGFGFVLNPAAAVSGIFTSSKMDEMMKNKEMMDVMLEQETPDDDEEDGSKAKCKPKADDKMKKCKDCGKCLPKDGEECDPEMEMCKCKPKAEEEDAKKCKPKASADEVNKNNSQNENSDVIKNKMKISKIDDIQQDKWGEIQASTVREFIQDEIKRISQTFEEAKAQTEAEQKALAEQKAKAEREVQESVEKISKLEKELGEIKAAQIAQETQAKFNERMSSLNEDYNLTKEASEIIAKQIQGLSDKDYINWKTQFEILSASLKKETKKEDIESVATKNLENVETNKTQSIPNASSVKDDVNEKLAKSFKLGEGVVVAKRK